MPASDQGIEKSLARGRFLSVPRTLVFVTRGERLLLLKGAADKPNWAGKYNGVGGHVERDEDVLAGARREVLEETGLEVARMELRGVLHVDGGHATAGVMLFVFRAECPVGDPVASREGSLEWFTMDTLPEENLVEDLPWILPKVLAPDTAGVFFGRTDYDGQGRMRIVFAENP